MNIPIPAAIDELKKAHYIPREAASDANVLIDAEGCRFEGKYVFWEVYGFKIHNCYFSEGARSSLWYAGDCTMTGCKVDAPKMFRRMSGIRIEDTTFNNGEEMMWDCENVTMKNVQVKNCDYLFMHTNNIRIDNYRQDGNYGFQYSKNVEIHNAVINSKDAFWEAENITLVDCELNGEYLGWYAKNMKLVRCRLSGEQLLCYVDGLTLEDASDATIKNNIAQSQSKSPIVIFFSR